MNIKYTQPVNVRKLTIARNKVENKTYHLLIHIPILKTGYCKE